MIQKSEKQDDYLYFLYRGVCKIIYPTANMAFFGDSAYFDKDKQQYMVLGHLERGAIFGEQSALNNLAPAYSIVAASKKVEYYKIHRAYFIQHFGGV